MVVVDILQDDLLWLLELEVVKRVGLLVVDEHLVRDLQSLGLQFFPIELLEEIVVLDLVEILNPNAFGYVSFQQFADQRLDFNGQITWVSQLSRLYIFKEVF